MRNRAFRLLRVWYFLRRNGGATARVVADALQPDGLVDAVAIRRHRGAVSQWLNQLKRRGCVTSSGSASFAPAVWTATSKQPHDRRGEPLASMANLTYVATREDLARASAALAAVRASGKRWYTGPSRGTLPPEKRATTGVPTLAQVWTTAVLS